MAKLSNPKDSGNVADKEKVRRKNILYVIGKFGDLALTKDVVREELKKSIPGYDVSTIGDYIDLLVETGEVERVPILHGKGKRPLGQDSYYFGYRVKKR